MIKSVYPKLRPFTIRPNNPKHEWLAKNYPGFLHTLFMQGAQAGVFEMNKLYPFGFKASYQINCQNKTGQLELFHFWDLRDLTRVRKLFLNKSKVNLKFFNKVYRRWQEDCQDNFKIYQQTKKIDFTRLKDIELYQWYEKLYLANIKQGRTGYLADCFLTVGSEDWLNDFIKSRLPKKFDLAKTVSVLTASTIPSYTNEEAIDLQRIKKTIRGRWRAYKEFLTYLKGNKKLWLALVNHAKWYYWVENNYFAKILKPEDFAKKIFASLSVKEIQDLSKVLSANLINKQRLLTKINDPWLTNVIKMSSLMTHMQDYRKMALVRFSHFLKLIFEEMANRTNLTLIAYYNLIFPEIDKVFLKKKIDRAKIKSRIIRNFSFGGPKGYVVYEGKDLKKYVNEKDFFPELKKVVEIKGVAACPGLIRGRVKIVKDAHQTLNLLKNTILVTNNTTPEFVPLIKQAVAIVTEQGGITTHAAIVSRELGIPCIIGTKIATQVLKDGDLVEVDAFKGIVRKLKN